MRRVLFYIGLFLFIAAGAYLQFALVGYGFLSLVCFGLAGLLLCFQLLHRLSRTHIQIAKGLKFLLVLVLSMGMLAVSVTGAQVARSAQGNPYAECDYIVVLGAFVNGTVPSFSLQSRLDTALYYLQRHPNTVCIVSGGQGPGEDISEALCMYDYLTERGIDEARIWMEDRSTSTRENLAFSLSLIEANTGSRPTEIGIVSNEYHLYRAGLVAREVGVSTVGIPAKTTLPVLYLNYFLREIPAIWYYALTGG